MGVIHTKPFSPIRESGMTELIGVDEQVDQNDYSGSVAVSLLVGVDPSPVSGIIRGLTFVSAGGAILQSTGTLFILDADPAVASGDTAMTAAEHATVIGSVTLAGSNWVADANGATAHVSAEIPFHDLTAIYLVYKHTLATAYNSAGGDNEYLNVNLWYEQAS